MSRKDEISRLDREGLEWLFHVTETTLKKWEAKFGMCNAGSLDKELTKFQKFVMRLIGLPITYV